MKFSDIKHNKVNTSGFTLIEMLVSLSLFTVVVTMSVGTLLVLIDANGRAQSMQLIMTNLSFSLDSMTREIRTGTYWYCDDASGTNPPGSIPAVTATRDCLPGDDGDYISIIETGDSITSPYGTNRITYAYDSDFYTSDTGIPNHGAILRKLGGPTGAESSWVPLTGTDILIDEMRLSVSETDTYSVSSNLFQPTVSIYIHGIAGLDSSGGAVTKTKEFELQTSITQRLIDI